MSKVNFQTLISWSSCNIPVKKPQSEESYLGFTFLSHHLSQPSAPERLNERVINGRKSPRRPGKIEFTPMERRVKRKKNQATR